MLLQKSTGSAEDFVTNIRGGLTRLPCALCTSAGGRGAAQAEGGAVRGGAGGRGAGAVPHPRVHRDGAPAGRNTTGHALPREGAHARARGATGSRPAIDAM
eukprot:2953111-Pyramimonas_sp.AAC.2